MSSLFVSNMFLILAHCTFLLKFLFKSLQNIFCSGRRRGDPVLRAHPLCNTGRIWVMACPGLLLQGHRSGYLLFMPLGNGQLLAGNVSFSLHCPFTSFYFSFRFLSFSVETKRRWVVAELQVIVFLGALLLYGVLYTF